VLVTLLVLTGGCSSPTSPAGVEAAAGSNSGAAAEIASLTNAERRQAGLPPFTISPLLMSAAQLQADQMASLGQMGHVLPGARYPEPQDRLAAVGYQWQATPRMWRTDRGVRPRPSARGWDLQAIGATSSIRG
jgi:uncharacterized protein YkwD